MVRNTFAVDARSGATAAIRRYMERRQIRSTSGWNPDGNSWFGVSFRQQERSQNFVRRAATVVARREIHGVSNRTDGKYVENLAVSAVASGQPMSSA